MLKSAALIAAMALAAPAAAEPKRTLMPTNPGALEFQNAVGYSDAVIHGDMIYLSGVVAGPAPGETDPAPGYHRAFKRIEAILKRAGASWDDVVTFDTFHTDLRGSIEPFAAVKNAYIKAPFPVWTAVGVTALYEPTATVEIKVSARAPAAKAK